MNICFFLLLFICESVIEKVRLVEDGWNSCDLVKIVLVYLLDMQWCNCVEFVMNCVEVQVFFEWKWKKELDYCLIKEFWVFIDNCIVVCYVYEWYDDLGNWFCFYGNENWEFELDGFMKWCFVCINDMFIKEFEWFFYWLLGRCLDDYLFLSDLGLQDFLFFWVCVIILGKE